MNKKLLGYADRMCRIAASSNKNLPDVRPYKNTQELIEACRILYRQYRKRNYCKENEHELYYSPFIFQPESRTFIGKIDAKIYGTVSLFPDSDDGLPVDTVCKEKIDLLRLAGGKVAEAGLLATELPRNSERKYSLASYDKFTPVFSLFRIIFRYALAIGVTDLVITVHPRHRELYSYLGFRQLSEEGRYDIGCGQKALPMYMNLESHGRLISNALRSFVYSRPRSEFDFEQVSHAVLEESGLFLVPEAA